MQIFNLFNATVIPHFGQTFNVEVGWLGEIVKWIISGVGLVGLGVVLFSLILKFIVLPLDIYQRITMRKQNQQMEANKERMEKLQKQYANDKEKYNQKVMEMYKENGMSMFSSCLPMILSMVIFIAAINAFNSYAQFANMSSYNMLVNAYNKQVEALAPEITDDNYVINGNTITVKSNDITDGKYAYYEVTFDTANAEITADIKGYVNKVLNYEVQGVNAKYYADTEKAYAYAEQSADFKALLASYEVKDENGAVKKEDTLSAYIKDIAQKAVVVAYEQEAKPAVSFLWIKNVWTTDASYEHPILPYSKFIQTMEQGNEGFNVNGEKVKLADLEGRTLSTAYKEATYDYVTGQLTNQKKEANGYFVLIILSIGTILLQQFVSMRSQKAQSQYSSVDGQGASQQKMMMIMMTVMFAVFSFMYSAAFSIYMIISNVFSLLSTLVINFFVDKFLEKKEAREAQAQYDKRFRATAKKSDKENKK